MFFNWLETDLLKSFHWCTGLADQLRPKLRPRAKGLETKTHSCSCSPASTFFLLNILWGPPCSVPMASGNLITGQGGRQRGNGLRETSWSGLAVTMLLHSGLGPLSAQLVSVQGPGPASSLLWAQGCRFGLARRGHLRPTGRDVSPGARAGCLAHWLPR